MNDQPKDSLTHLVAENLHRLRQQRGLSLQRLADASGVSRAMLGQIELGKSAPTVNVLWKIARALEVSMSVMVADRTPGAGLIVPVEKAKSQLSRDGTVASRPLFPKDVRRSVEFFETRLASGAIERHDPHPPCTRENLVVSVGAVEIDINGKLHMLGTGDAILFDSDVPHVYRNTGANEALIYVVITYCDAGR